MKNFKTLAALALVAPVLLSTPAFAETRAAEFANQATIAGKFEIESSQLALQKSKDSDIKAFAQKMISDHSQADRELKSVLPRANISSTNLPKTLDETHLKALDSLKQSKSEDFDKNYVQAQKSAHDEAVSLFKTYAAEGDNESMKKFAAKTLPKLQEHSDKVSALLKKQDDIAAAAAATKDDVKMKSDSSTDKPVSK